MSLCSSTSPERQHKRKREEDTRLPSPSPTKLNKATCDPRSSESTAPVRSPQIARGTGLTDPRKRARLSSGSTPAKDKLAWWLSTLPQEENIQDRAPAALIDNMSRPPSKRSRPSDTLGQPSLLPEDADASDNDTPLSTRRKYAVYRNANYGVILETKGSYMRASDSGMAEQDWELCKTLLTAQQSIDFDPLFDSHLDPFLANLEGRSEAHICTHLHPRLAPSVENLFIRGRTDFKGLIEGYNEPWIKSIPFYGPRPQPDHTYGFKWSNFSATQRRKLGIDPFQKSYYTAREEMYFPFLTAEVKCGKQGLDFADRPNMHSMTIAMRAVVNVYRKAGRAAEVHRRVLGFTISHDDKWVRLSAYYPELNGEETTYWRTLLKGFAIAHQGGEDRWASHQFVLNVCEKFALPLLERLKEVIDELPDPASEAAAFEAALQGSSVQEALEDGSGREASIRTPVSVGGLGAELRSTVQLLLQRLDEQEANHARAVEELKQMMKEQEK